MFTIQGPVEPDITVDPLNYTLLQFIDVIVATFAASRTFHKDLLLPLALNHRIMEFMIHILATSPRGSAAMAWQPAVNNN